MSRWYKDVVDRPPPPSRVTTDHMMAEQVYLYRHVPSLGQPIPVGVNPFPIELYVPKYKYIAWAVHRIFLNLLVGPSGMRAEHLCQWLHEVTWEEDPDTTNWHKVVTIVQSEFRYGTLTDEITCRIVLLIPNGDSGDLRWIVLVEVLWKTVTGILNRRFTAVITFHDVL